MQVIAQQGDTLDALCHRHLGRTADVVERVLATQPRLAELGPVLPHGTVVDLPDAPPATSTRPLIQLWD